MADIELFWNLKKNILPKYGKISELVKQPGPAGTKKIILTTEAQRTQSFFYKNFFSVSLCLCGEKIFYQNVARFHDTVTFFFSLRVTS
jgi:hypothetical protein